MCGEDMCFESNSQKIFKIWGPPSIVLTCLTEFFHLPIRHGFPLRVPPSCEFNSGCQDLSAVFQYYSILACFCTLVQLSSDSVLESEEFLSYPKGENKVLAGVCCLQRTSETLCRGPLAAKMVPSSCHHVHYRSRCHGNHKCHGQ